MDIYFRNSTHLTAPILNGKLSIFEFYYNTHSILHYLYKYPDELNKRFVDLFHFEMVLDARLPGFHVFRFLVFVNLSMPFKEVRVLPMNELRFLYTKDMHLQFYETFTGTMLEVLFMMIKCPRDLCYEISSLVNDLLEENKLASGGHCYELLGDDVKFIELRKFDRMNRLRKWKLLSKKLNADVSLVLYNFLF